MRRQEYVDEDSFSMDCSCQILYDTSLSNVSDSECTCSDCLQANLNAFNEFKNENVDSTNIIKRNSGNPRGFSTVHKKRENNDRNNRSTDKFQTNSNYQNNNKNIRKGNQAKTKKKWNLYRDREDQGYIENDEAFNEYDRLNDKELDEFLMITKNRTRKYLQQNKSLENAKKKQKQDLKEKIKKNLQILRVTAKVVQQRNLQNQQQQSKIHHPYKWNHSKYVCQCNGQPINHKNECCRLIKVKSQLDTNLGTEFIEHRDLILQQKKQKRVKEQNYVEKPCPYDKCKNHHNRTDPSKIKKIEKFIEKEANKYREEVKNKKKKEEENEKTRRAKLRAIDIKSKQIVSKSKKYDDNISRTSFKLSIDNFDTFSELREDNEDRKKQRKAKRKVKAELANGGGNIEDKMYNISEEQEDDFYEKKDNKIVGRMRKEDYYEQEGGKEWCQKIVRDAKISSPKNIGKYKEKPQVEKPKKKQTNLNSKKEEEQRKRVEQQLNKKKQQIMKEYEKRNMNKGIREEYEKKQKSKKSSSTKMMGDEKKKDVYRQNYKYQAGKDVKQINAHGDPLLQEYVYHDGERLKAVVGQDHEIYTQNINSLTAKTKLKL